MFMTISNLSGLGLKSNCNANKGRYGIIDEHGKLVLPLTYDLIKRPSRYSDYANIFVATKGNKITTSMNMLMRFQQKVLYHIDMVMQILLVQTYTTKKGEAQL